MINNLSMKNNTITVKRGQKATIIQLQFQSRFLVVPAMFSWHKQSAGPVVLYASFGPRSFWSSDPTAWIDTLAHLCNSDLMLNDFRQLLKTALFNCFGLVAVRAFVAVFC